MSTTMQLNGVPFDRLSLENINIIHRVLRKTDDWLVRTFFGRTITQGSYDVLLGEVTGTEGFAAYVRPGTHGRLISDSHAATATSVKAPYLKDQANVTLENTFDSLMLEMLSKAGVISTAGGSNMPIEDRFRASQMVKFDRLKTRQVNAKVRMVSELIRTGKIVVQSEGAEPVTIDYGRDPGADITVLNAWTAGASTPVKDIKAALKAHRDLNDGSSAGVILTTPDVLADLSAHQDFNDVFKRTQYTQTPALSGVDIAFNVADEPRLMGLLDGVQVWTYAGKYGGVGGASILPARFFAVTSSVGSNTSSIVQCPIAHAGANFQALEMYAHEWMDEATGGVSMSMEGSFLAVPATKNNFVILSGV